MGVILRCLLAALGLWLGAVSVVAAPQYPTRPITLVVPFSAGGAVDVVARILAENASRSLGQPMVVENITGAGGTIAAARVARAAPNGYTILVGNLGTQVSSIGNYKNLAYDPLRDFAPVMRVANAPEALVINKTLPCEILKDFVAYSKSSEPSLTFGNAGIGSISHLAYLLLSQLSGANFVAVPYPGDPQADLDLIAGRLGAAFSQAVLAASQVKLGKARALVSASPQRSAILPDVPSAAEAGMPDLLVNAWTAFLRRAARPSRLLKS